MSKIQVFHHNTKSLYVRFIECMKRINIVKLGILIKSEGYFKVAFISILIFQMYFRGEV